MDLFRPQTCLDMPRLWLILLKENLKTNETLSQGNISVCRNTCPQLLSKSTFRVTDIRQRWIQNARGGIESRLQASLPPACSSTRRQNERSLEESFKRRFKGDVIAAGLRRCATPEDLKVCVCCSSPSFTLQSCTTVGWKIPV